MPERTMQGDPASPGAAVGRAWQQAQQIEVGEVVPANEREHECEVAHAALADAASALGRVAASLSPDEAAIIEAGVLMAEDPALLSAVEVGTVTDGLPAGQAIIRATGQLAQPEAHPSLSQPPRRSAARGLRPSGRRPR